MKPEFSFKDNKMKPNRCSVAMLCKKKQTNKLQFYLECWSFISFPSNVVDWVTDVPKQNARISIDKQNIESENLNFIRNSCERVKWVYLLAFLVDLVLSSKRRALGAKRKPKLMPLCLSP